MLYSRWQLRIDLEKVKITETHIFLTHYMITWFVISLKDIFQIAIFIQQATNGQSEGRRVRLTAGPTVVYRFSGSAGMKNAPLNRNTPITD